MSIKKIKKILKTLRKASKDLLWMSESEAPFDAVRIPGGCFGLLLFLTSKNPVEQVEFDAFFADVTEVQDWFGEAETAIAHQYQHLAETLKTHLQDLQVYRVGAINVDIYILGRTASGDWVGLKTHAVET